MKKIIYSSLLLGAVLMTSCAEDYTETQQGTNFSSEQIEAMLANPEKATIAVNAAERGKERSRAMNGFAEVGSHEDFGQKAVDIYMDAMSNDMVILRNDWFAYAYTYQDRVQTGNTATIYNYFAKSIALTDNAIQLLMKADKNYANTPIYARLLAFRGYAYLYLTQLYSWEGKSVPFSYVDESGVEHRSESRISVEKMNENIKKELTQAFDILEKTAFVRSDKSVIDKNVVAGILSRYYLFVNNNGEAARYALIALDNKADFNDFSVVNSGTFSQLNNQDWMWGYPIDGSNTGFFASYFSHMDTFNQGYARRGATTKGIDRRLYDGMNSTDKRKTEWFADGVKKYTSKYWTVKEPVVIPKYVNTKFKDDSNFQGDYLYMRKTEMYFNYMEAIAVSNPAEAQDLLVKYMTSRDADYTFVGRNKSGKEFGVSRETLLDEIRFQKRIEFWGEGFGLLDMKRWNLGLQRKYGKAVLNDKGDVVNEGTLSNHKYNPGLFDLPVRSNSFILQFPLNEFNVYRGKLEQNPVE